MRKRLLSLLLVACMVLPLIPLAALPVLATESEAGPEILAISKYTGDTNSVTTKPITPGAEIIPFYQWFASAAEDAEPLAANTAMADGMELRINPTLFSNNIIAEDMTYAKAIAEYKEYIADMCRIYEYQDGNWQMGVYKNGFEKILYVHPIAQANIFAVGVKSSTDSTIVCKTTASGVGGAGFGGQFAVTESFFMETLEQYINGNGLLTAYVPADDTPVDDISIVYNSAEDTALCFDTKSNTNVAQPAFGAQPGGTQKSTDYFALRAGATSSGGGAAYGWTVPAHGRLTITLDDVLKVWESSTTISWEVKRNNKTVIEKTDTDISSADAIAAMKDKLAENSFLVEKGDVVSLVLYRKADKCTLNMALTATLVADSGYTTSFGPNSENYVSVSGNSASGTVYQPDAWKAGSLLIEGADTTDRLTNAETGETYFDQSKLVITDTFTEYYKIHTDSGPAVINAGGSPAGVWGSNKKEGGGGLWLQSSGFKNMMSAGVNYTESAPRIVKSFYGTSAIRYTAEYAGDVTATFSVDYYTTNGSYVVILHNGVKKATYTTGTKTGSLLIEGVLPGDTIDFVNMPDLNFDEDSYSVDDKYSSFNYNTMPKRGVIIDEFTVTYDSAVVLPYGESWTKDAATITLTTGETLDQLKTNAADHFLFRWYTTKNEPVETANVTVDTLSYAEINPALMSPDTANILSTDTYKEAFDKYSRYLQKLCAVDYENGWAPVELDNKNNTYEMAYLFTTESRNPFMISSSTKLAPLTVRGLVGAATWKTIMQSYYDATFSSGKGSIVGFDGNTAVSNIRVTYSDALISGTSSTYSGALAYGQKGWSALTGANAANTASALGALSYLRTVDGSNMAMQWTATYDGSVVLNLDSLAYYAETQYPYFAWSLYKNGQPITLNTEGLTLTSMASWMSTNFTEFDNNKSDVTALQNMSSGMYYNSSTKRYEVGS